MKLHANGRRAAVPLITFTAAISLLTGALLLPSKILADNAPARTFTVDVSLGYPYAQNNVNPAEGQDTFALGDTFIQDGNIFPAGTIPAGKTKFDPNTPGAIGQYRVRGTFTTDAANFIRASEHKSAPSHVAFASEIFLFGNDKQLPFAADHRSMILTDGIWPNAYFSAARVLLGGTGSFRDVVGEVQEENIGENKHGFCNFRVTFTIRTADNGQSR